MPQIKENIARIRNRIASAAVRSGRQPNDITLVCVTKHIPAESIRDAVLCGVKAIGENRVEEAAEKKEKIKADVSWHMIGHLQRRKAKEAVRIFDLIHSVDSVPLSVEIDKRARSAGIVQDILLQVNVSGEPSKYGFPPGDIPSALNCITVLKNVRVLGFMTMAPLLEDIEDTRPVFRGLRLLSEKAKDIDVRYLSMGMTRDYIPAIIEEGSNMVRIGTGIFY